MGSLDKSITMLGPICKCNETIYPNKNIMTDCRKKEKKEGPVTWPTVDVMSTF